MNIASNMTLMSQILRNNQTNINRIRKNEEKPKKQDYKIVNIIEDGKSIIKFENKKGEEKK